MAYVILAVPFVVTWLFVSWQLNWDPTAVIIIFLLCAFEFALLAVVPPKISLPISILLVIGMVAYASRGRSR